MYATYLIPAERFDALKKKVDKIARKIAKGKTQADVVPSVEAIREVFWIDDPEAILREGVTQLVDYRGPMRTNHTYSEFARPVPMIWTTIRYSLPKMADWSLQAVFEWDVVPAVDGKGDTTTCYMNTVPGVEVPMELREPQQGRCDHCNANRRRTKALLVLNEKTGEYKVVGTTCLKDFLGHLDANDLVAIYKQFLAIDEYSMDEDEWFGGGSGERYYTVREITELAAMMFRLFGYVSAQAWDDRSTASRIFGYINPNSFDKEEVAFRRNNAPTDEDCETAAKVVEWVMEQDNKSEWIDTIQKCVIAGAVRSKRVAVLASAISGYQKYLGWKAKHELEQKAKATRANEWVGDVKERLRNISGAVIRTRMTNGYYGSTQIVTILSEEGNTFVWFASGHGELYEGDKITFDATVKKHDEFNGTKQTVVTRVKFVTKEEAA